MRSTLRSQGDLDILDMAPEHLVPVLYARVLDHLDSALAAIDARDSDARADHLERAVAIILELMATLDFERGGEVAPRLMALYSYFASELAAIGRTLDTALLRRIIEMIAGLHESWEQAARLTAPGGGAGRPRIVAAASSFS